MSQEIVETLRRLYDGWSKGDFTVGMSLFDEHVAFIVRPGFPTETALIGLDQMRQHMREILVAWERYTVAAESFRGAGDSVLVAVRQHGVGAGSRVPVEMTFFHAWTFRAGKAVRLEIIAGEGEALEAVGLSE